MPPNAEDKQYQRWGVSPPTRDPHLTEDDIAQQLKGVKHGNWKQRGNVLYCHKCPHIHATEPIPVDYMLQGTDDNGHPILKKLGSK